MPFTWHSRPGCRGLTPLHHLGAWLVILRASFEWNLLGINYPRGNQTHIFKMPLWLLERHQIDYPGGCSSLDFKNHLFSLWQQSDNRPPPVPPICLRKKGSQKRAFCVSPSLLRASQWGVNCQDRFCVHGHLLTGLWENANILFSPWLSRHH